MSLFLLNPNATIHRRFFYLRDDGDPSMQVGRCDSIILFQILEGAIGTSPFAKFPMDDVAMAK